MSLRRSRVMRRRRAWAWRSHACMRPHRCASRACMHGARRTIDLEALEGPVALEALRQDLAPVVAKAVVCVSGRTTHESRSRVLLT
eukprot:6196770-Pleurochrysis_carterae.AAC.1